MRTLAEGSIDRARAKRTQRGQGLRPSAVTRRAANETKWVRRPIPLSPRERALELWERERTSEMKWASCPIPLSPWERGKCSCIEREREGTESDRTIPSLSLLERGRSNCESVKGLAKWNELVVPSLSLLEWKTRFPTLKTRQNFLKMVIFSTSVVKKWIFVIKMYSFLKNMLYLFTWTYQRGALICLRNSKRPSKNLTK